MHVLLYVCMYYIITYVHVCMSMRVNVVVLFVVVLCTLWEIVCAIKISQFVLRCVHSHTCQWNSKHQIYVTTTNLYLQVLHVCLLS